MSITKWTDLRVVLVPRLIERHSCSLYCMLMCCNAVLFVAILFTGICRSWNTKTQKCRWSPWKWWHQHHGSKSILVVPVYCASYQNCGTSFFMLSFLYFCSKCTLSLDAFRWCSCAQKSLFVISEDDTRILIDCDSRTREEIHDHIKQILGKTE